MDRPTALLITILACAMAGCVDNANAQWTVAWDHFDVDLPTYSKLISSNGEVTTTNHVPTDNLSALFVNVTARFPPNLNRLVNITVDLTVQNVTDTMYMQVKPVPLGYRFAMGPHIRNYVAPPSTTTFHDSASAERFLESQHFQTTGIPFEIRIATETEDPLMTSFELDVNVTFRFRTGSIVSLPGT